MECVARGFPIPRIRWLQNNQLTPYNDSVIEIAAVTYRHTGVYRCVAENVAGNASATAVLAVRGWSVLLPPLHTHPGQSTSGTDKHDFL